MRLVPMTKEEYNHWAPRSRREYAADKKRANGFTEEEATNHSETVFHQLLPQGQETKENYLFSMKKEDGERVGYLWLMIRGAADNRKAYIGDIVVEEEFRGKGFGRKAMLLAEEESRKLGLKEIGLHVFGFNERAIHLYSSLGYETTDLMMAKKL